MKKKEKKSLNPLWTPQLWPSGLTHSSTSRAIRPLEVTTCTGMLPAGVFSFMVDLRTLKVQDLMLSGIQIQPWEPPKKTISDLLHCSCSFALYPEKKVLPEEHLRECSLAHSFPKFILVVQIYFNIHSNDNFSLNAGNIQHVGLVGVWFS